MKKILIIGFSVLFCSLIPIIGYKLTEKAKIEDKLEFIVAEADKLEGIPKNSFVRVSPKNTKPLSVYVGDKITLEYSYAVVPGAFPEKVYINSTTKAVSKENIWNYSEHTGGPIKVGGGTLIGTFNAVEKGDSSITF